MNPYKNLPTIILLIVNIIWWSYVFMAFPGLVEVNQRIEVLSTILFVFNFIYTIVRTRIKKPCAIQKELEFDQDIKLLEHKLNQ